MMLPFGYLCDYGTQISLMPLLEDKSNHEVLAALFLGETSIKKKCNIESYLSLLIIIPRHARLVALK